MTPLSKTLVAAATVLILLGLVHDAARGDQTQRERVDLENLFTPSGWMGDGEHGRKYIEFSGTDRTNPHSAPASIKITYTFGPTRWGGIYWQNRPDNWGDEPGTNYSGKGFTKITFWARGEAGNEVVEFKAGGISNKTKSYRDSFGITIGRVALTKAWKQYHIDVSKSDLSSVIGGFCWVGSSDYNAARKITFYIDDIFLE